MVNFRERPVLTAIIAGLVLAAIGFAYDLVNQELGIAVLIKSYFEHALRLVASNTTIILIILIAFSASEAIAIFILLGQHLKHRQDQVAKPFGFVNVHKRAEGNIIRTLTEPQTIFSWYGYSAVNVVVPVPNENIIRQKAKSGVQYNFTIVDPEATYAYLLHALHERNSEDQGKGYIMRSLSAMREMQRDNLSLFVKFRYFPPILRVICLDNSRMFIGCYPENQCGIDSQEIELVRHENPVLYDFIEQNEKRLDSISSYLKSKDYIISLIFRRFVGRENLFIFLQSLNYGSMDKDHARIIRIELPEFLDRSQAPDYEARLDRMREYEMLSESRNELFLTKVASSAAAQHKDLVAAIKQALKNTPPLKGAALAPVAKQTSRASFAVDLDSLRGLRIPGLGAVGATRRAFSGWIFDGIVAVLPREVLSSMDYPVAVIHNCGLYPVRQDSFLDDEILVISWGSNSNRIIEAIAAAAQNFDASNFDKDGYWKG